MTPATLSPSPLAYEKPIHPAKVSRITTNTELPIDDTNKSTPDDKYPWLDPDDPRRNMTDKEILRMKLNLKDSILNEKEKEDFLMKVEQFTDVFSLRDEIALVHLRSTSETKRQNTILCKTLSNERRTEESHTKRNGQTQAFRHYP